MVEFVSYNNVTNINYILNITLHVYSPINSPFVALHFAIAANKAATSSRDTFISIYGC